MTQPAGWYDDPHDPAQLRYWDGVLWSGNVTPKVLPTLGESNIGMPYGVSPGRPPRLEMVGSNGTQPPPPLTASTHPPARPDSAAGKPLAR